MIKANCLFVFPACALITQLCGCSFGGKSDTGAGKAAAGPEAVSLVQLLTGGKTGFFRNTRLGDSPAQVKQSEKKAPDETDSNYLAYTMPMDTLHPDSVNGDIDSLNFFTIAYNFDHGRLTEADEDIFLASDSDAAKLYARLSVFFTAMHGNGMPVEDSMIWNFKSGDKNMKISLSDQSPEYDYGKLSLVFYSED